VNRARAAIAALPDTANALAFAAAWVAPALVGLPFVRTMFVTFLLEFFAVHAGGMLMGFSQTHGVRDVKALLMLVALALLYLGMGAMFCAIFDTWWPLVSLSLVVLAKVLPILLRRDTSEDLHGPALWALGAVCYLGAVFATTLLPVPALGIDEAMRTALDLPGSGEWIDAPQKPLASGAIYFGLLAWLRYVLLKPRTARAGASGATA